MALLLWMLLSISIGSFAQTDGGVSIGKGDSPANRSAILELVSTNKGLLIPRLTTEQRNGMYPDVSARGLLVFDTSLNGFYFWDGSSWKAIASSNIRTVWSTPTIPGTAGELVFDVASSLLYVYSGSSWVNIGGNSNQTPPTIIKDQSLTGAGITTSPLGVAQGGITSDKLASNAVTGDKIAISTITGDKIANNTINIGKIQGGNGDQVLTTNSAGSPEWIPKSTFQGGNGQLKLNETLSYDANGKLTIAPQTAQDGYILQWDAGTPWGWKPSKITTKNMKMRGDEMGEKGQVLTSYGNGEFMWKDMPTSGGTGIIADGSITTAKIADDAVTAEKIKDGAIMGGNLNQMGAIKDQVLAWNGSLWVPSTVSANGTYSLPTASAITLGGVRIANSSDLTIDNNGFLTIANATIQPGNLTGLSGSGISGQVLSSNGTGGFAWVNAAQGGGSVTLSPSTENYLTLAGTILTANKVNLGTQVTGTLPTASITDGAVTSAKIADNTIQAADLSSMGLTNAVADQGKVLQWNGTLWAPATVTSGGSSYVLPTASASTLGGVKIGNSFSVDADGVLSVSNGSITSGSLNVSNTGTNGQILSKNNSGGFTWIDATSGGSGDITDVVAGTGLTGGAIAGSATLSLSATGVTPGSYTNADITVDAQGRITSVANGTGGGDGSLTANNGLTVSGSNIALGGELTAATTITLNNNNLSITPGSGGTGKTIVNNFQTAGAVYGKVRVNTTDFSIWYDDDYIVILRKSGPNDVYLPNPTTCPGRVLIVRNDSGNGGTADTYTFKTYVPVNNSSLTAAPAGKGMMLVSDGSAWFCVAGGS